VGLALGVLIELVTVEIVSRRVFESAIHNLSQVVEFPGVTIPEVNIDKTCRC